SMNGNVYQFLGIPYAQPPTKELGLRWKAPENRAPWSDTLLTTSFKPVCPQKRFEQNDTTFTIIGDEDCLYLNIWTPQLGTANKAVMVFIHGGGNQQGGASESAGGTQIYFGKNLAQRGDVVVVTIQYRLGALGFLVHPGLEAENPTNKSGNYAVLDQILALTWIKNNISAFGGDTTKIMILGESAGGINVGNLLTTPLASGLFQRACIQSASPVLGSYNDAKTKGINWVNQFISTGTDIQKIAHLRQLEEDSLVRFDSSPLSGGVVQGNWGPVVDGVLFSNFPIQVFQTGIFNQVPLIIGSNADEMSLSAPPVVTPVMVQALVNSTIPPAYQAQALTLYPPGSNNTQAKNSYVQLLSDAQFTTPARRTAVCISQNQTQPVWRYFFTHKHTIPQLASFGSYHGMELFYVFNNWENATLGQGILFKPADDSVQQAMLRYWVNFANTGNPNGAGLVNWNQFQSSTDCYLEIKATPNGSQCGLKTAESDFWDTVSGFSGCTSTVEQETFYRPEANQLYPNPARDILMIRNSEDWSLLEIIHLAGQVVKRIENTRQSSILIADLKSGIYIVKIYCNNGQIQLQKLWKL
ncbi:MAG: carboxylesterase family protein, partial [Bacteroidia bacterium]|nr:carboxylesterase family protein [Bacteroidia bacterium]